MGDSSIEWTKKVWNPVTGCTKVSPGCKHCYAETFAERWRGVAGHAYEQGFDLKLWPSRLTLPLAWKKPQKVFVNSMSDLFHADVPEDFIARVFSVMGQAERHTFQVLTKRAARMRALLTSPRWAAMKPLKNVWLGVSVENQAAANERVPLLLGTPAAVRWVSAEPLLERVDLFTPAFNGAESFSAMGGLNWVVVGGESGAGARRFDMEWAHALVEDCRQARVPVFVKQMGANAFCHGARVLLEKRVYVGDQTSGTLQWKRDPKGGWMPGWPEALRVREFPR